MEDFNKEDLDFFLPDFFKGLSKEYLLECIFDETIQKNWMPTVGDIIVGCTGNVYVISGIDNLHEKLGGKRYYFGSCNHTGGNILDETYCYTANESGKYYHPTEGEIINSYHSSIRKFKFVPYPHERNKKL